MRNVLKRILLVFTIICSISSWGTSVVPVIEVNKEDTKLLHISLSELNKTSFLKIKDMNNFTLYEEKINVGKFSKNYDLSSLKSGKYIIEIHEETLVRKIPVNIVSNEIHMDEKDEVIIYRPGVRFKNDYLTINRMRLNKGKDLEILLYNESGNLIHKETLGSNFPDGRIFDISNLENGNYKIVMKTTGIVFTEEIQKS